ncbi:MAG: tetratricopeptide repeat protein [Bacteroidales bacterium]
MKLLKNKNTRVVIIIMVTLVVLSIIFSKFYYKNVNDSVDPRIVTARNMYEKYNDLTQDHQYEDVIVLMDSIQQIFDQHDFYTNSFETGVLANNRAAVYLSVALHKDSLKALSKAEKLTKLSVDSLLDLATSELQFTLDVYYDWKNTYAEMNRKEWKNKIKNNFYQGLEAYNAEEKEAFLENRLDLMEDTKTEIDRRLSVSHTNMGMVYRLREEYDSAVHQYAKAMELWDRNLTAKNNLNVLLDKPIEKRNVIQKLFPPDRDNN